MSNFAYIQDIPNGPNNPSADQPNMRTNTNSIFLWTDVDHIGFEADNGGYHSVIHQPPKNGDPGAIVGIGQTYTKTISGDQQLFYESGGGIITQLTGGAAPSPGPNGYVYLDGGILIQWGTVTPTSGNITVSFSTANINFPGNCFNVQVTRQRAASNPGASYSYWVNNASLSNTGFTVINNDGHSYGIYWFAIGN